MTAIGQTITGTSGNDFVVGNTGNDTFVTSFVGAGQDVIVGVENLVINNRNVKSEHIDGFHDGTDLIMIYEGNTSNKAGISNNVDTSDSLTLKNFFTGADTIAYTAVEGGVSGNTYYQANMTLNGKSNQVIFYKDGTGTIYCMNSDGNDVIPDYTSYVSGAAPYYLSTTPYLNYHNSVFNPLNFKVKGNTYNYITNANSVITGMQEYNSKGQLISEYEFGLNGGGSYDKSYHKTTYSYDGLGNLTTTQKYRYDDPTGMLTEYEKDVMTAFISSAATGNDNISVSLPKYISSSDEIYSRVDDDHLIITAATSNASATIDLTYSIISSGDTLNGSYNGDLKINGANDMDPSTVVLTQVYDFGGRLVYEQMPNDSDGALETRTFTYDSDGNLTEETYIEVQYPEVGNDTLDSYTKEYTYLGDNTISMQETQGNDTTTYYYSDITGTNNLYTGTNASDLISGSVGADTINGGRGSDTMIGGNGNDTYYVDNSNDKIIEGTPGSNQADTVLASVNYTLSSNVESLILTGKSNISGKGNGQDNTIIGNNGNNILAGDAGNDSLNGGKGNDVYWIYSGDGNDTITDTSGTNTVKFNDLNLSDITDMSTAGNDTLSTALSLNITTGNDSVAMDFSNKNHSILQFQDGISFDMKNYSNFTTLPIGDSLNDVMFVAGAYNIDGGAGNDLIVYRNSYAVTIAGGAGNDIISSGSGNDTLMGGDGNDIYEVGSGSGNDTITDTVGSNTIKLCDTNLSDLTLINRNVGGTAHQLELGLSTSQILKVIGSTGNSTNLQFADGVSVDLKSYKNYIDASDDTLTGSSNNDFMYLTDSNGAIAGGAGNDLIIYNNSTTSATISGGAGNDILVDGARNDTLDGGAGNDEYVFKRGDGHDLVKDAKGTDAIIFGTNVTLEDIAIYKDTLDNEYIDYGNTAGHDVITIDAGTKIEKIQMYDGSYLTNKDIDHLIQSMASYITSHSITSVGTVKLDDNLMPMIVSSWHLSSTHTSE